MNKKLFIAVAFVVVSALTSSALINDSQMRVSVSSPLQCVSECTISEESPISYEIKDETERRGSEIIHFYSLWVKNHSGQDLYVHGKVHLLGTVQRRPFAGTVPAYKKKCIFSTIDEDFEVEEMYYQDSLGF